MGRNIINIIVSILIVLNAISCDKNPTENENTFEIGFKVTPNIGIIGTKFKITDILVDSSSLRPGSGYRYRVDWDNNGEYDTDWIDTLSVLHSFSENGKKDISILIEDSLGVESIYKQSVYVQELIHVIENSGNAIGQQNIDWCPDGTNRIAFEWYASDDPMHHAIWVMTYPGGEPQLLKEREGDYLFFPEWSPDGNKIALNSNNNGFGIYDLQTDSIYFPGIIHFAWSRWSPDGKWILFPGQLSQTDLQTLIWDVEQDTFEVFNENYIIMCWSLHGDKIAYCDDDSTISIMDFSTREIIKRFDNIRRDQLGMKLDWSPDGNWISLGFGSGYQTLNILNYETGEIITAHLDSLNMCWYPTWSSDGRLIAFEALNEQYGSRSSIWAFEFPF